MNKDKTSRNRCLYHVKCLKLRSENGDGVSAVLGGRLQFARERASVPESAASPRRPPRGPHLGLSFVVPSVVREPCEAPAAGWSRPARTLLEGRWLWVDLPHHTHRGCAQHSEEQTFGKREWRDSVQRVSVK